MRKFKPCRHGGSGELASVCQRKRAA
jgi:hypothetical protein